MTELRHFVSAVLLLIIAIPSISFAEGDWLENAIDDSPLAAFVADVIDEPAAAPVQVSSHSMPDQSDSGTDELRDISAQLADIAAELREAAIAQREAAEVPGQATMMTDTVSRSDWLDEVDRINQLESSQSDLGRKVDQYGADWIREVERVNNLASDVKELGDSQIDIVAAIDRLRSEMVTEDRIREIAREEIRANISVQTPQGNVVSRSVAVPSTGGGFQLAPGEQLVAVDGVPVSFAQSQFSQPRAVQTVNTPQYRVQTQPASRQFRLFGNSLFRSSNSQCANGSCN